MNYATDTEFAYAVRLAASGLRPKAGFDVAIEGAALRSILCSERPLDPDGLELLAQAVTGQLRKSRKSPMGETIFAHAVRRASNAWRSGKGDVPISTGEALAGMIRTGKPVLGGGERVKLAELFAPIPPDILDAREGRPPKQAGNLDVVAVVATLRALLACGALRKNSIADTAKIHKLSIRTVEEYEAKAKKREEETQISKL